MRGAGTPPASCASGSFDELRSNVALRVAETETADTFLVSGRGELHLAILIETMRREGYEFQVSRPEVILREGEAGELLEPFEEVHIETSPETVGVVVEMLGGRRGQMLDMQETQENSVQAAVPGANPRSVGLPLPVPHRHAWRGYHAHHLLRLPAHGRRHERALQRLAGRLGTW